MTDERRPEGPGALLGKTVSRREAIKLGVAGSGALFVSMYVTPKIQNIGPARATHGTPHIGSQGCTPGYWQNIAQHPWPSGYQPEDLWSKHFNVGAVAVLAGKTLYDLLPPPDPIGCAKVFAMHAVAALLNAASLGVEYPLTVSQVKSRVNAAVALGDCLTLDAEKDVLESFNLLGCPL